MVDIPEHLLLRSAEARAKALGISVDQALAEMKGESEPTVVSKDPEVKVIEEAPAPAVEAPAPAAEEAPAPAAEEAPAPAAEEAPAPAAAAVKTDAPDEVDFAPEVKVTQRLLTVVKAKPIQKPVAEPVDKVNTWPHLMLPEFVALTAMTAFLIFLSAIIIFFTLEKLTQHLHTKVIILTLLLSTQGYYFMYDLEKIIINRLQFTLESKDSVYNYHPKEYSINELQQKNISMLNLLSDKIDSSSKILSSAYAGIPLKKLNLQFNQVKIIYSEITKSDILWLVSSQGSKNYLLLNKENSKEVLKNFSQMLIPLGLEMKIIAQNNCCLLIKTKDN